MIDNAKNHSNVLPSDYRKHKVLVFNRAPGKARVASYWDGGSRPEFTLVRAGRHVPATKIINPLHPPSATDQEIDLLAGDVLVQTGIFCGKTACAIINYVREESQPVEIRY